MITLAKELKNKEITYCIVPKNVKEGDSILIINGVKNKKVLEGKGNSPGSATLTLSYKRRADDIEDIFKIIKMAPTA